MMRDAIATARRAGATGPILVRADSTYCSSAIVRAVRGAGASFTVGMPLNSRVRAAIDTIEESAWVRIEYPWAIPDLDTCELTCAAEIAEVEYTAFTSRAVGQQVTARMIVRRIPERNESTLQDPLFPAWRYHALFTNSPAALIEAEATHRGHAIIEQVISDLKNSPLAHLPSGKFAANAAWLALRGDRVQPHPRPGHPGRRSLHPRDHRHYPGPNPQQPARVARSARGLRLRLPAQWAWSRAWQDIWTAVMTT